MSKDKILFLNNRAIDTIFVALSRPNGKQLMADSVILFIFAAVLTNLNHRRMMKNWIFSLCMAAVSFGLASCGTSRSAATLADVEGEWNVVEIEGSAVVPAPGQEFPFMGFNCQENRIYGHAGCNRLVGTLDATAKPGNIDFRALGSTRMMCPDMANEQHLFAALERVKRYRLIDATTLGLFGSSKQPLVVLKKR